MEPFRFHIFVCDQQKAEGVPCCSANGSGKILDALRKELGAQGLANDVQVNTCSCLGLCDRGPIMITYPEGTWYGRLTPADVPEIVSSHLKGGQPVARLALSDGAAMAAEIRDHREKYMAAMKARDAAGILPDDLNQLTGSFWESRTLLTALELDLFTAVGGGATAAEVAGKVKTNVRATEMLLNALTAMKLLSKTGDVFQTTAVTGRFFTAGSPDNHQPALMHWVHLWDTWSTLTEAVRTGTAVQPGAADADHTDTFISAMHRNALERAPHVLRAVGPNGARRMLDLGGGSGAYSIAFAKAVPELRSEVLDLEKVVPITRDYIAKAGLSDRITARAGDMLADRFGQNYDLILLSAICHMFTPEQNQDLFARARMALAPGGRFVVQDFILKPDKTAPRLAALFSLNMLVNTKAGADYSVVEYEQWLRQAGFQEVQHVPLPGPSGLMVARKS